MDLLEIKKLGYEYKDLYQSTLLNNKINGVGIGQGSQGSYCIVIYLQNNNGIEKLPITFKDCEVIIRTIGNIVPL